jgi:AAA family ATP:ADP antiporter
MRLFADVKPQEGITCLILIANIFLILTAYYLIKPVRESWLVITDIQGFTKVEVKAYSAFAQSILLVAILPLYSRLASKVSRRNLILSVGGCFALLLLGFWFVQPGPNQSVFPYMGIIFYLFVGIFSVTLVAQFWAFSSDLYGPERGKRLFPIVAIGAAMGAVFGSWIGEHLIRDVGLEAFDLILISLVPLGLALAMAAWSDRRGTYGSPSSWTTDRWQEAAAPSNQGPFNLIMGHRYLVATALMILIFTWVVASGDNILFAVVQKTVTESLVGQNLTDADYAIALKEATTLFYSSLYFWVNLFALILQAFFVSRILKYGGMRMLLLTTPIISLFAYAAMMFAPVLAIVKAVKVAENSSNLSVNNTARHMLWLPTSKEMLYKAKPTIDTLFVRLGDGMAALTVLIGTRVVELTMANFIFINLVLIVVWIILCIYLYQENHRWSEAQLEEFADVIPK